MSESGTATTDDSAIYRFGRGLDGNSLLGRGWGEPEKGFVWSEGKCNEISLPAVPGANILSISMWGYVFGETRTQEVLVFVNGRMCGYFEISAKAVIRVPYLTDTGGPRVEVSFYIPTAKSPHDAEGVADKRCLGIALSVIQVSKDTGREGSASPS